jgi:hypothetical protein
MIANTGQANAMVIPSVAYPGERGDACECGDANGDGKVDVADLVAANNCIFGTCINRDLCDADGNGTCDVADIVAINLEIFAGADESVAICRQSGGAPIQTCPGTAASCPP